MNYVLPVLKTLAKGVITGFTLTVGAMAARELAKRAGLVETKKEETTAVSTVGVL